MEQHRTQAEVIHKTSGIAAWPQRCGHLCALPPVGARFRADTHVLGRRGKYQPPLGQNGLHWPGVESSYSTWFAYGMRLAESAEIGAPLLQAVALWRIKRNASAFQHAFAVCMLHMQ